MVRFIFLVIALEEHHLAFPFVGEDVGSNAIEEPAIVADDKHCAGILQHGVFQGSERFHVQIVGRFVEHEHV